MPMKRFMMLLIMSSLASIACAQPSRDDKPTTAYIQSLAIDPQTPQRIYAAAMGDGFYLSDDAGENWQFIDTLKRIKIAQVIEIDPRNPQRVFAAGDQGGVWMSVDRGSHWQSIAPDTLSVCDIALDPRNPDRLLVLAENGVYRCKNIQSAAWEHVFNYPAFIKKWNSVHKNGITWKYTRFQKIAIDPHQPQTIFIGARWEGGYHRSDDGGDTWQHLSLGGIIRRVDPILFHPSYPNIIMVGTHHQGFFKSYNAGFSWVSMSHGMIPQRRTPYYGAVLVSGLAAAPSNSNVLYTGGDNSNWKSTDGGLSWREMGKSLTCPFARAFAVDPIDENMVYAGTNVGVYKSTNGGETWRFCSKGMPTVAILPTVDLPLHDGLYRFALADQKPLIFRRALNPLENWLPINWLLPEPCMLIEKGDGTDELRLVNETRTFTSLDGGLRWDDPDPLFIDMKSTLERMPFHGHANDPTLWTVEINLSGRIFFDDRWVGTFYRRPPYITLYLVSTDYPCDNSKPYWQTTIDHATQFTVQIPRAGLPKKKLFLYCEVRDFQRNTLIGFTRVDPGKTKKATLAISPDNRLPALHDMIRKPVHTH